MFFAQFMGWLTDQLQLYVSTQAVRAGTALAPAASALGGIYVMSWGYLCMTGTITEPFMDGVKRIVTLGLVLGAALHLWLYNDIIAALLVQGPKELAAAMLGAQDPITMIDEIWSTGGACAGTLWNRGGVFSGDVGFYLAGAAVWIIIGLLCLYCAFLMALSQIATAVLLAIGPLFILTFLFERTRQWFDSWVCQLLNYGLVGLLVALCAGLLLQFIVHYAEQTAARGSELATVDVLDLLLAAGLVILLLQQIMSIAAGLSRGVSLSTMGAFRASLDAGRNAGRAARGAVAASFAPDEPPEFDRERAAPSHIVPQQASVVTPVWRRRES